MKTQNKDTKFFVYEKTHFHLQGIYQDEKSAQESIDNPSHEIRIAEWTEGPLPKWYETKQLKK